jgi:hypothetical protein
MLFVHLRSARVWRDLVSDNGMPPAAVVEDFVELKDHRPEFTSVLQGCRRPLKSIGAGRSERLPRSEGTLALKEVP